jgi:NADH-quinone oxidoreductase subunit L
VFVTAFYSFRMYFLGFDGKERFHYAHHHHHVVQEHAEDHHDHTPHESPWVVTIPLLALAVPSLAIGYMTIGPMLFGEYFGNAIYVADSHPAMRELAHHFHGAAAMGLHAVTTVPFWLAVAGVGLSWFFYMKRQDIPAMLQKKFGLVYAILERKYGFDEFNDWFFAGGARLLGGGLWRLGDQTVIDGWLVNGSARLVGYASRLIRHVQSGYIYHYAFAMIIGVFVLVTWFVRATA